MIAIKTSSTKDLVTKPSPSQSMPRKWSVKFWASNKGTYMSIWVTMLTMMLPTLYSAASFSISGSISGWLLKKPPILT